MQAGVFGNFGGFAAGCGRTREERYLDAGETLGYERSHYDNIFFFRG
jgi:hypothetical protein